MGEGRRGRPSRVKGQRSTTKIWAFVTAEERQAIARVADDFHQPVAVVIREAVNAFVADYSDRQVFSATGKSILARD